MPQHKSAKKRVRQNEKRRLHNRQLRSRMRTMIKKLQTTEDPAEAQTLLNAVKAYVDRLATKRIIHPNKAAHYKSRLEKRVNSLG
ncbi:MAG: 30S ribosomal protein S20 [Bacteroidetes bacterium]|nr:MAG: 30S ribosomal protein S20 [Bacteroidota bacterium]